MMRHTRFLVVGPFTVAAISLISLAALSAPPPGEAKRSGDAHGSNPTFAFGSVISGQDVRHVFTLVNERDEPLKIAKVRATCGCTLADDWEREVPAGGTWTLPVTLKTERLRGDVRKTVVVEVAGPHAQRIEFALAGHVQPHFEITPSRNLIFTWTERAEPTAAEDHDYEPARRAGRHHQGRGRTTRPSRSR